MRDGSLAWPFASSLIIHLIVVAAASFMTHNRSYRPREFVPIGLIDLPPRKEILPAPKPKSRPVVKKPEPPPPSVKKTSPPKPKPAPKPEEVKAEPPPNEIVKALEPLPRVKEEAVKPAETKSPPPTGPQTFASGAKVEGGGSEAGAGNLFGKGDVGVVPGTGTAGGSGGTAVSGLGRGSGAPGLPAQTAPLKTNREAKPIQTVKATYPPMALRMGLESDVILKIEVDPEGKVTKAQITKSGGAGFDEEALKAVTRSRFEPAQRDGQTIPAEFTYIYRFRLRR